MTSVPEVFAIVRLTRGVRDGSRFFAPPVRFVANFLEDTFMAGCQVAHYDSGGWCTAVE